MTKALSFGALKHFFQKKNTPVNVLVYANVSAVAILLLITPTAQALTRTVESSTVIDKRDYPIIFIHGAAGAELEMGGTNLWPGYVSGVVSDYGSTNMALKEDGKTDCCGTVKATEVMRYGGGYNTGIFDARFAPVYQGFYDYMEAQGYGYEKPKADGKVFYDFVYDWRKDNRLWTKDLEAKINTVLSETKAEKVILIGHSMGGLQIRLYMKDASRAKKVGGVIFIGTPHNGAPQVLWAYTYGYNFGNTKVSDGRMWEVMQNWPAGYQLLPDFPSITDSTGRTWSVAEMSDPKFYSYQEFQHQIQASLIDQVYTMKPGLPNEKFAKDAIAFHKYLGDSVDKYAGVKYFHIAGDKQDTVQSFTAELEERSDMDKPFLKLTKVISKDGDGTVPAAGAKIEGVNEFITVTGEHGSLPGLPVVTEHVTRIRKDVNNEDFRIQVAKSLQRIAEENLPKLEQNRKRTSSGASSEDKENIALIFLQMLIMGQPDEEKVKLKNEIADRAARIFENAVVNIKFPKGEKEAEQEDTVYLVIKNFKPIASGNGTISPSTLTLTFDSYQTFYDITFDKMTPEHAYKAGKVTMQGGGVAGFVMKIGQWAAKYGWIKI